MQPIPRTAARSLRQVRTTCPRRSSRSYASGHGSESHGSHDAHHHAAPATESFGSGFYIAIAAVPAAFAVYKFTSQGKDGELPYLSRLIRDKVESYKSQWTDRNALHTQAMEQAAADRSLFLNEPNQGVRHVELKFPEILNASSPWNVPAGHGSANIDTLIAKYEKEAYEANEAKHQQLRDNNVPAEKPVKPYNVV